MGSEMCIRDSLVDLTAVRVLAGDVQVRVRVAGDARERPGRDGEGLHELVVLVILVDLSLIHI